MPLDSASDALPPPPPYEPVASRQRSQHRQPVSATQPSHQQYAPPPFPPPGHVPPSATSASNMMNADPLAYVQAQQPAGATATAQSTSQYPVTNPFAPSHVATHAQSMSEEARRPAQSSSSAGIQRQPSIKENQLEFLRSYDTIFIVDDSSSMNVNERPDGSMGQSRWEEARDALAGMVELAAKYDDDGVELHFLNSDKCLLNCRDPRQVKQLFDSITPEGLTPTGTKLELLLLQYMDDIETHKQARTGIEPKKRNYVIITDGAATDDPESVILTTAMRLDRGNFPLAQVGVQFVQVGDDVEAREALKELDDALQMQHSCRDIVDTVPYSGMVLNSELLIKVSRAEMLMRRPLLSLTVPF